MKNRDHQWNSLQQWYATFQNHQSAQLEATENRFGADLRSVLTKLNAKQLQSIVSLIAVSNAYGHHTAREFQRSMREDRFNKPVFERRHAFKVIQGGAA